MNLMLHILAQPLRKLPALSIVLTGLLMLGANSAANAQTEPIHVRVENLLTLANKRPTFQSGNDPMITMSTVAFLDPNERHPRDAQPMLADSAPGAYIAVGTERCFMMGILLAQINQLVCIDRNPMVVAYNLINATLLKLSVSRPDYLDLLLTDELIQWIQKAQGSTVLNEDEKRLLSNVKVFEFWRYRVRESKAFDPFHKRYEDNNPSAPFAGAHYLYDNTAYARIARLAKSDRVESELVDLNEPNALSSIFASLDQKQISVSVIDISNAWWSKYAGPHLVHVVTGPLIKRRDPKARLVYTSFLNNPKVDRIWNYGGVDIETLRQPQAQTKLAKYFQRLEKRTRIGALLQSETNQLNGYLVLQPCRDELR